MTSEWCRGEVGNSHYCPNCDNSLGDLATRIADLERELSEARERVAIHEHNVAAWQKVADENIARRRELEAEREVTESNMRELERELGEVRAELEGRRD